jgi:DNA-binding Lrp family transcriptional regulator
LTVAQGVRCNGPDGAPGDEEGGAMKAYVLVETSAGKTKAVKKALSRLKPGKCRIESLDAVTGPYDYVAVVQGPTLDDIGQLVTEGIGAIDGVTRTTTCLAVSIG